MFVNKMCRDSYSHLRLVNIKNKKDFAIVSGNTVICLSDCSSSYCTNKNK